jgi:hypothetical protein
LLAENVRVAYTRIVMENGWVWALKLFVFASVIIKEKVRRRLLVGYQYLTPNTQTNSHLRRYPKMIISVYYYSEDKSFDYLLYDLICEPCGQDHSFKPSFEAVSTSIDINPELLATRKEHSLECNFAIKKRNRGLR